MLGVMDGDAARALPEAGRSTERIARPFGGLLSHGSQA